MPFPILAIVGLCKVCAAVGGAIFCVHKVAKSYEKGQKTKQQKINAKSQADLTKIQGAQQNKQNLQAEETNWKQKYEELDQKENETERKIEQLQNRSRDPNLSQEEKNNCLLQIATLRNELDTIRNEKKGVSSKIKSIGEQIKQEDKIINTTGSGSYDSDRHWIWDLFTIENMLIVGACYVLYKLTKDEK